VETAELTARHVGVAADDVLVASTGVIGTLLPMERIRKDIPEIKLITDGGHELARAIMTTDTVPKEVAVRADGFTIGGMAKGSGMIHPNLATMLCFLTTDAVVDAGYLKIALKATAPTIWCLSWLTERPGESRSWRGVNGLRCFKKH